MLFTASLVIISVLLLTPAYAESIIPEGVTAHTFNTLEMLDDNKAKVTMKILFTNTEKEKKNITFPNNFSLDLFNMDIYGTPQVSARFGSSVPSRLNRINDQYVELITDLYTIPLEPVNYDYLEITYVITNASITTSSLLKEEKEVDYRFATLGGVNEYGLVLKIPKKPFSFTGFNVFHPKSVFPPPSSSYETEGFYEYAWNSIRFPEKYEFVVPIMVSYEYSFDFGVFLLLVKNISIIIIVPIIIRLVAEDLIKKIDLRGWIKSKWSKLFCSDSSQSVPSTCSAPSPNPSPQQPKESDRQDPDAV